MTFTKLACYLFQLNNWVFFLHMFKHISFIVEAHLTKLANKGFLSCVNSNMSVTIGFGLEGLHTVPAAEKGPF